MSALFANLPDNKEPVKKTTEIGSIKQAGSGGFQLNLHSANEDKKDEAAGEKPGAAATGLFGQIMNKKEGEKNVADIYGRQQCL